MDLKGIVAVLLLSSLSVQALPPSQVAIENGKQFSAGDEVVLAFDDIVLKDPISDISTYDGFHFEGFKIVDFPRAYQDGLIESDAQDCANSTPNALLGLRVAGQPTPGFMLPSALGDTTTSDFSNDPKHFKLRSFSLKPIESSQLAPTYGYLVGTSRTGNGSNLTTFLAPFFEAGSVSAWTANLTELGWWPEGINAVTAYSVDTFGNDYQFCLDNIDIEYV